MSTEGPRASSGHLTSGFPVSTGPGLDPVTLSAPPWSAGSLCPLPRPPAGAPYCCACGNAGRPFRQAGTEPRASESSRGRAALQAEEALQRSPHRARPRPGGLRRRQLRRRRRREPRPCSMRGGPRRGRLGRLPLPHHDRSPLLEVCKELLAGLIDHHLPRREGGAQRARVRAQPRGDPSAAFRWTGAIGGALTHGVMPQARSVSGLDRASAIPRLDVLDLSLQLPQLREALLVGGLRGLLRRSSGRRASAGTTALCLTPECARVGCAGRANARRGSRPRHLLEGVELLLPRVLLRRVLVLGHRRRHPLRALPLDEPLQLVDAVPRGIHGLAERLGRGVLVPQERDVLLDDLRRSEVSSREQRSSAQEGGKSRGRHIPIFAISCSKRARPRLALAVAAAEGLERLVPVRQDVQVRQDVRAASLDGRGGGRHNPISQELRLGSSRKLCVCAGDRVGPAWAHLRPHHGGRRLRGPGAGCRRPPVGASAERGTRAARPQAVGPLRPLHGRCPRRLLGAGLRRALLPAPAGPAGGGARGGEERAGPGRDARKRVRDDPPCGGSESHRAELAAGAAARTPPSCRACSRGSRSRGSAA